MKKLCVIGSLNTDLVTRMERFPAPGETVRGVDFGIFAGGKGANQAVAAARLGGEVLFIGKVGDDHYGADYLALFEREGVSTRGVGIERSASSGVAVIMIDGRGENTIVVTPGANSAVDVAFLLSKWELLESFDIFLLQLEIPIETVVEAAKRLHAAGKTVILDPAPAAPVPPDLLRSVDYLTPNEHELAVLAGQGGRDFESAGAAARTLVSSGGGTVVLKRGAEGAAIVSSDLSVRVPGFPVRAVDTTAAGDTFNGALGVALAEGMSLRDAVLFANAAGALSTTAFGAQSAMPKRAAVMALIGGRGGGNHNAPSEQS
ncbi:MAG TPA: ribokinase [Spirochaetia bacterium]|nr:ribokinase [Spirochaetia bacterium]